MEKRRNSILIPYYFRDGNLHVFLQRRSHEAPRNPNILGGFGGGLEGDENNEKTLLRELREELEYTPKKYSLLGVFETDHSISNYYIEKVSEDFENNIKIHEGTGGEWHRAQDVIERDDISPNTRRVITTMILDTNGKVK
ncbi:MAG: hypothetical protein A3B10_03705 [Candidatus Doudnabacteria bacterium RIFCSPLOWO2_01_FULL_44_21]|uniref:Nudix hydrolase domain-containing protein n=1 Tax=Candidatus Doudnabacteria bacterium RIFCSPLOWO2_01_FULL_44_21 TaxID=1817841 RepID=A0A1F5PYE3_9BACT|nr:MAG: hypothetical protein A3B95_02140 [Candidatus Doudnabacteria bacterium RIFCSPHIGHO2_02_FULL_43_13b]OGE94867.1 MAG: hypothetical protein A3B10_03705 [Candidatus Doudnabacteria bacterium RIFCSPLOWO2_01_FULL_44_21]